MDKSKAHQISITIPAVKAVVSGFFVGLLALSIAVIAEASRAWAWGLLSFTVTSTLAWFSYSASMLYYLESILGVDINDDGYIADLPSAVDNDDRGSLISVMGPEGNQGQLLRFPVSDNKMREVAVKYFNSRSFSTRSLSGSRAPLTQAEFNILRDYMLSKGWARYRNSKYPTQGLEVTKKGEAVLKSFHPTPADL